MASQSVSLKKKWLWTLSLVLNWSFLETPPILRFCFDPIAQNENVEYIDICSFPSILKFFIKLKDLLMVI